MSSQKPKPGIDLWDHRLRAPPSPGGEADTVHGAATLRSWIPERGRGHGPWDTAERQVGVGCLVPLGRQGCLLLQNPRRWPLSATAFTLGSIPEDSTRLYTDTAAYWLEREALCVKGSNSRWFAVRRAPVHFLHSLQLLVFLHREEAKCLLIAVLSSVGCHQQHRSQCTDYSNADSPQPHGRTIEPEWQGKSLEIDKPVP